MNHCIDEPARSTPIAATVDVVVAGGGAAGFAAAVCAARLGLDTVMVEAAAAPGGMITHVTQWLNDFDNKGGIVREFMSAIDSAGCWRRPNYNPFTTVGVIDDMLSEAGVRVLYLAQATEPILADGRVAGVIIESRQGRSAIRAKVVIDATGDGTIATRANARWELGRPEDGACQAISISQLLTNYRAGTMDVREDILAPLREQDPDFTLLYDHGGIKPLTGTANSLLLGLPHVIGVNPVDQWQLSDALVALRAQSRDICAHLRQLPGLEGLEEGPGSAVPGVRESRRIVCDYMIEEDDLDVGRKHDDGLFTCTQTLDIHKRVPEDPAIILKRVAPYHVPYRALLPLGIEGLLVTGRCLGGSHRAQASYRIIADCMASAEAAALAAREAIDNDCTPREIAVDRLVAAMADRGYER